MTEIVQKENKILRNIAKTVPIEEIKSKKIQGIIADMKKSLSGQKDGVAIAAPQIAESLRIFVVSGIVLKEAIKDEKLTGEDMVFINPEIIKISREKKMMEEGCLSVRYLYGKVNRAIKVLIRAYDEKGNLFERGASGLLAQIFQHEIDHLNGILFIDKASNVEEIPPENFK